MALADKSEVNNFLSRLREVIGKINGFQFVDREKNLNSLYKHGLTLDIAKFYIETLEVKIIGRVLNLITRIIIIMIGGFSPEKSTLLWETHYFT